MLAHKAHDRGKHHKITHKHPDKPPTLSGDGIGHGAFIPLGNIEILPILKDRLTDHTVGIRASVDRRIGGIKADDVILLDRCVIDPLDQNVGITLDGRLHAVRHNMHHGIPEDSRHLSAKIRRNKHTDDKRGHKQRAPP